MTLDGHFSPWAAAEVWGKYKQAYRERETQGRAHWDAEAEPRDTKWWLACYMVASGNQPVFIHQGTPGPSTPETQPSIMFVKWGTKGGVYWRELTRMKDSLMLLSKWPWFSFLQPFQALLLVAHLQTLCGLKIIRNSGDLAPHKTHSPSSFSSNFTAHPVSFLFRPRVFLCVMLSHECMRHDGWASGHGDQRGDLAQGSKIKVGLKNY